MPNPKGWRYFSAVKPAVQLLQIHEVHPGPNSNACNFLPFLSIFFIPVLSRPSFTSRTPNKGQKIEQLFYFLPSPITRRCSWAPQWTFLCMLFASTHKKCLAQKVGHLGYWFPWFNHHSIARVALQYEPGTRFFHWAVPELHAAKFRANFWFQRMNTLYKV